ncbi:MAG: hypothetical protein HY678_11060 [Chloroflexi bacterium]|nr:hypothetical protein [Chloroflexota bacterium]
MQLDSIPGSARTWKLSLPISRQAVKSAAWPASGLFVAAALAAARVAWNISHPDDLFIDSWVLVHILDLLDGKVEPLPRATLTLQYPLAYLPFLPLAKLIGAYATVKVVYGVAASLAAVPAYLLTRRGQMPLVGMAALVLIPDFLIKGLNGTPQGIAFPVYLLALYFALRGRRLWFVIAATAVLLTHHLTGLVTLVTYFAVLVVPRVREPGFFKTEWPHLVYFSAWPAWWAWTFGITDQAYLAPMLLVLAAAIGVPLAVLAYAVGPWLERLIDRAGRRLAGWSLTGVLLAAVVAGAAGWLVAGSLVNAPSLSSSAIASRVTVALYAAVLTASLAAAIARKHVALTVLIAVLLGLGASTVTLGCQRVFDGLRLVDYAAVGGVVALFVGGRAPRWSSRTLLILIGVAVLAAGILRMQTSYERLFAFTEGQREAARWVAGSVPPAASIATDTKMSLLVLGDSGRNATFEGTWWLYSGSSVGPYVAALNHHEAFIDRPIEYVLLTDYMFERGAEIAWFAPVMTATPSLADELDGLGSRVYERQGTTIWKLDPGSVEAAAAGHPGVDFKAGLPHTAGIHIGGLCD